MNNAVRLQLARTALAEQSTAHAIEFSGAAKTDQQWLLDGIVLQQCSDCQKHHYPAQALCPNCLSDQLSWQKRGGSGRLVSFTHLHVSFNSFYHENGPWSVAIVEQEDGARLYTLLQLESPTIGDAVKLYTVPDIIGQSIVVAVADDDSATQEVQRFAEKLMHQPQTMV